MESENNSNGKRFRRETDLLNNYLWENHREDLQWRRVRLGVVPTKEMARQYMVLLRWADAVVIHNNEVLIIEAKLRPQPGAIGQLELYQELFPQTPEFSAYKNHRIRLVFLTQFPDVDLAQLCSKKGIDYVIWPPLSDEEITQD